ncbi:MAG TPA: L-threonylcarbamoyladenylate synthase [Nitrososphaerales archaeon]|nr:L-threonylcarbamoyladenylate synthase [Nitrososphaerales archaeon]
MVVSLSCDSDFSRIRNPILEGAVVIFPTDTVYGLGSNPYSLKGIRNCFEIKKRDSSKRMPVLISNIEMGSHLVQFGEKSRLLAKHFWPGKLTLILRVKESNLPQELIGNEGTLAIRVPNHECCLRLISICGGALIGTSANISGESPFTDSRDSSLLDLAKKADFFISGKCGEDGLSSTIVDASRDDSIRITREGAIPGDRVLTYLENISKIDRS